MTSMSPNESRKKGFESLAEAIGPIGMIRFLQQFDIGKGDYTEERRELLKNLSIDEISGQI